LTVNSIRRRQNIQENTMLTAHKSHLPHKVYHGKGKTLEAAIEAAHQQIPVPRHGAGFHPDTKLGKDHKPIGEVKLVAAGAHTKADVIIKSKVVACGFESGGIAGIREFWADVIEA
jgi:hypothetical protein